MTDQHPALDALDFEHREIVSRRIELEILFGAKEFVKTLYDVALRIDDVQRVMGQVVAAQLVTTTKYDPEATLSGQPLDFARLVSKHVPVKCIPRLEMCPGVTGQGALRQVNYPRPLLPGREQQTLDRD